MKVALLRRPQGFFVLEIGRGEDFRPPTVDEETFDVGDPYWERVRPVGPADPPFGYDAELESALAHLAAAQPSAETLSAVFQVLVLSVADPGAYGQTLPPLRLEEPSPPHSPTAANPRAFKGTKDRPPKPTQPAAVDLRPYLDGGRNEAALLRQLAPYLDDASSLNRFGEIFAPRGEDALRPYAQWWSEDHGIDFVAMPADFRRSFLWSVRAMNKSDLGSLVAAYWSLELGKHPALRKMAAGMMSSAPLSSIVAWIRSLELAAPHRRTALAELMLVSGAYHHLRADPSALISRLEGLCCDDKTYRHRAHALLTAVAERRSTDFIFDGFELANHFAPGSTFKYQGDGPPCLAPVLAAMEVIGESDSEWARTRFALQLWELCGRFEGFTEVLETLPWVELGANGAYAFADLLYDITYGKLEDWALEAKWDCVRRQVGGMFELFCGLDAGYRSKARQHFSEVLGLWDDTDKLERALRRYRGLLPRICRPPFDRAGKGAFMLDTFTRLDDASWDVVAAAADASFHRLESDSERGNDEQLIGNGLWSMSLALPELTARCFASCPGRLFATARTWGCVPDGARLALLHEHKREPALNEDPHQLTTARLVERADEWGGRAAATLVSRKLRRHLNGSAELKATQLERARGKILESWDTILLAYLDTAAFRYLAGNVGLEELPDSETERHAVLFQRFNYEHRRPIRKLLKEHFRGRGAAPTKHPKNQEWLHSHATIDGDLWTRGIELRRETSSFGAVCLALERDPLEVLRMGTYVGTCFGLGGGHSYSAAAVVLDVNKQVVYCRNARGKVIARQLLALSKDESLHCFPIYPDESSGEIQQLFFDYDRSFAAALDVPIHDPTGGDLEIEFLVAKEMWFDNPIDIDEEGAPTSSRSAGDRKGAAG